MSDQPGVPLKYLVRANPRPSASLSGQTATYIPMEAIHEFAGVDVELSRPSEELSQGYSYIENGDVAYAKVTPCFENGKGFVARNLPEGRAFATTEVTVLRPGNGISTEYLGWLLQSEDFKSRATAAMTGAGGLKRVPESFTLGFRVPLTEVVHQQAIADFLDRETAEIDAFVAESEKLITLLNERRAAVITQAVTKGLDPTAPMKETGIEWLGSVPKSWDVMALARGARISNGADYKEVEVADGGYPVYGSGGEFRRASSFLYEGTSVLFGRKGTVDRPMLVSGRFWTVDTMFYSRINSKIWLPEFIYFWATILPYELWSTSTALPSMTSSAILSAIVPTPSIAEQRRVVEFLGDLTAKIDEAIETAREAIALAKERRQALISAAVTGKIDVRAAA